MTPVVVCPGCSREFTSEHWAKRRWGERCNQCVKRAWRQRNGDAVEREREAARQWKREHLGQPGLARRAS